MDKAPSAGWGVHGVVMGVLVAIGLAVTVADYRSSSSGNFISLKGMLAFLAWIALGAFAVASTITFALLRHRWGAVPCYLLAVPLAAAPWLFHVAREHRSARRQDKEQAAELVARLELVSWYPRTLEPGRLRLHAEVRALRDLRVGFDGWAYDRAASAYASVEKKPEPLPLKAGQTARLELDFKFPPEHPPDTHVLQLLTWVDDRPGVVSYEPIDRDVSDGAWSLRRPLPPPQPPPGK